MPDLRKWGPRFICIRKDEDMHRPYVARRFQSLRAGLSLDTSALSRYEDIIDLSIGDTDLVTDSRIIDAAFADARAGYTHYGDPKGDPELITALCRAWEEDFGQAVSEDRFLVTASSCLGMSLVMLGILDPGDEVLVPGPYFGPYRDQIELAGGVCVEVPTLPEENYAISEDRLCAAVTPRSKAIIFNNPCNPTGMAYERGDLEVLARVAQKYDLLIVADEIYTAYLYEGSFVPMRNLPGMAERTVTLNSFSKNFLMTGWRVGCIIAEPELLAVFSAVNASLIYTAPSVSQRAAIRALSLRQDIRRQYVEKYRERVQYACMRVAALPYLSLVPPKGTFYLFPGIERTGLSTPDFCRVLLDQAHILVAPGDAFGQAGQGHIRIACTVGMDRLKEAFDRMEELSIQ